MMDDRSTGSHGARREPEDAAISRVPKKACNLGCRSRLKDMSSKSHFILALIHVMRQAMRLATLGE